VSPNRAVVNFLFLFFLDLRCRSQIPSALFPFDFVVIIKTRSRKRDHVPTFFPRRFRVVASTVFFLPFSPFASSDDLGGCLTSVLVKSTILVADLINLPVVMTYWFSPPSLLRRDTVSPSYSESLPARTRFPYIRGSGDLLYLSSSFHPPDHFLGSEALKWLLSPPVDDKAALCRLPFRVSTTLLGDGLP